MFEYRDDIYNSAIPEIDPLELTVSQQLGNNWHFEGKSKKLPDVVIYYTVIHTPTNTEEKIFTDKAKAKQHCKMLGKSFHIRAHRQLQKDYDEYSRKIREQRRFENTPVHRPLNASRPAGVTIRRKKNDVYQPRKTL